MPFDEIQDAIINHKLAEITGLVDQALDAGFQPSDIMEQGLIAPMDLIGERFASGDIYVPEMMVSAHVMKAGLDQLKPHLMGGEIKSKGRVLIGTVKGDLHDIGKNIVAMMIEAAGFEVIDLGIDQSADVIAQKIKEYNPGVLGLSALLTTTMNEIMNVLEVLSEQGIREQVKVIVGGAPLSPEFAAEVGADGFGANATEAVNLCKQFMA
jgi:5-methyltetrahydrofolate--homocysteine methyltransferase